MSLRFSAFDQHGSMFWCMTEECLRLHDEDICPKIENFSLAM
jgi:hypothetical protein